MDPVLMIGILAAKACLVDRVPPSGSVSYALPQNDTWKGTALMAMRRPNLEDNLKGAWRAIKNGSVIKFGGVWTETMKAHDERIKHEERNKAMGTGEVGGGRNWSPPVHATTQDGRPVTVSFGQGSREGDTLIADGHVDFDTFYERRRDGLKGHNHYLVNGDQAGGIDRGRYTD